MDSIRCACQSGFEQRMIYFPVMARLLTPMESRPTRRQFLKGATAQIAIASAAQKQAGLKIFVLWDMEGTSGIFTREQAWYWEPNVKENIPGEIHQRFTSSVNSASAAALAADRRPCFRA